MALSDIMPLAWFHATLDESDKYHYHPCPMSFFPALKFIWQRYHEPNIVAKMDGDTILGFAFLRDLELGIVVHPSYRNLGIGHELLKRIGGRAHLRVNANNYSAIKLYLDMGFVITGHELDSQMRNLIRMENK